jgi:hypothetical protein
MLEYVRICLILLSYASYLVFLAVFDDFFLFWDTQIIFFSIFLHFYKDYT